MEHTGLNFWQSQGAHFLQCKLRPLARLRRCALNSSCLKAPHHFLLRRAAPDTLNTAAPPLIHTSTQKKQALRISQCRPPAPRQVPRCPPPAAACFSNRRPGWAAWGPAPSPPGTTRSRRNRAKWRSSTTGKSCGKGSSWRSGSLSSSVSCTTARWVETYGQYAHLSATPLKPYANSERQNDTLGKLSAWIKSLLRWAEFALAVCFQIHLYDDQFICGCSRSMSFQRRQSHAPTFTAYPDTLHSWSSGWLVFLCPLQHSYHQVYKRGDDNQDTTTVWCNRVALCWIAGHSDFGTICRLFFHPRGRWGRERPTEMTWPEESREGEGDCERGGCAFYASVVFLGLCPFSGCVKVRDRERAIVIGIIVLLPVLAICDFGIMTNRFVEP